MDAHKEMGQNNITFEDLQAAASENGKSVEETFQIFDRTREADQVDHPNEYESSASPSM
jgi:hypothetical protein